MSQNPLRSRSLPVLILGLSLLFALGSATAMATESPEGDVAEMTDEVVVDHDLFRSDANVQQDGMEHPPSDRPEPAEGMRGMDRRHDHLEHRGHEHPRNGGDRHEHPNEAPHEHPAEPLSDPPSDPSEDRPTNQREDHARVDVPNPVHERERPARPERAVRPDRVERPDDIPRPTERRNPTDRPRRNRDR